MAARLGPKRVGPGPKRVGRGPKGVGPGPQRVASGRKGAGLRPVDGGVPGPQIAEIQRLRLLAAAIRAVEELGYAGTTVAQITNRARVSRRTFYELFANREECLAAVLQDVVATLEGELGVLELEGLAWRERVRIGLWKILEFFDREPVLARVCVVQVLGGGPAMLQRREEILARLTDVVDEGRSESGRAAGLTRLTAEGLVGAAFAVMHARLLKGSDQPLTELLGELMGLIVLPYQGAAVARREQARAVPRARAGQAAGAVRVAQAVGDPLDGVSMRLTYRTARVLEGIGEHPGASNRAIAELAGISDQGQVSKLLARLQRLGLLVNRCEGHVKGEPNAWSLTTKGELVSQSIRTHLPRQRRAA